MAEQHCAFFFDAHLVSNHDETTQRRYSEESVARQVRIHQHGRYETAGRTTAR